MTFRLLWSNLKISRSDAVKKYERVLVFALLGKVGPIPTVRERRPEHDPGGAHQGEGAVSNSPAGGTWLACFFRSLISRPVSEESVIDHGAGGLDHRPWWIAHAEAELAEENRDQMSGGRPVETGTKVQRLVYPLHRVQQDAADPGGDLLIAARQLWVLGRCLTPGPPQTVKASLRVRQHLNEPLDSGEGIGRELEGAKVARQDVERLAHRDEEELALIAEVAVEGAGTDLGLGRDSVDGGVGVAHLIEDDLGSHGQPLPLGMAAWLLGLARDIEDGEEMGWSDNDGMHGAVLNASAPSY